MVPSERGAHVKRLVLSWSARLRSDSTYVVQSSRNQLDDHCFLRPTPVYNFDPELLAHFPLGDRGVIDAIVTRAHPHQGQASSAGPTHHSHPLWRPKAMGVCDEDWYRIRKRTRSPTRRFSGIPSWGQTGRSESSQGSGGRHQRWNHGQAPHRPRRISSKGRPSGGTSVNSSRSSSA